MIKRTSISSEINPRNSTHSFLELEFCFDKKALSSSSNNEDFRGFRWGRDGFSYINKRKE